MMSTNYEVPHCFFFYFPPIFLFQALIFSFFIVKQLQMMRTKQAKFQINS
jgi:hypothetical protein